MGGAFPKTHLSRQPRPPGQERPEADSGRSELQCGWGPRPGPQAAGASPLPGGGQPGGGSSPERGAPEAGGGARAAGAARARSSSARHLGPAARPSVSPQGAALSSPGCQRLTEALSGALRGGRALGRGLPRDRGSPRPASPRPACSWSPLATGPGEKLAGSRCVGPGSTGSWCKCAGKGALWPPRPREEGRLGTGLWGAVPHGPELEASSAAQPGAERPATPKGLVPLVSRCPQRGGQAP